MSRTGRVWPVCLLVGALLAAACASGPPPARPADRGEPAFQRVLDRIGDDGTIDRDTALQAFSLAFSPVPGTRPPAGPRPVIQSGSGPLRWVMSHYGELTPAQQRAVRAAIPAPARRAAQRTDGTTLMAASELDHFVQLVHQAWSYWSSKLPRGSLLHPIDVGQVSVTLNDTNEYGSRAYTFAVDAQGADVGPIDSCDIYFNPLARSGTEDGKREAAYHEVFHCFQAQMVPDLAGFNRVAGDPPRNPGPGSWMVEGAASWAMDTAAATLGGAAPYGAPFWGKYFGTPATPLFKRSYDAIGFFAHLEESGVDVLARYPAAMRAVVQGGNVAAFDAFFAGTSPDRFFATWPTGLVRKPALGPEWDAHGPGITADAVVPGDVVADNGSPQTGGAVRAYANADRLVAVSAEVLLIGAGRYSHMRQMSGLFDSTSPADIYCTKGAACACPQGSPRAAVAFKALNNGSYYLALGGGPTGNQWTVAASSLDQFCSQPAADACLYGTWRLSGLPAGGLPSPPSLDLAFTKLDEVITITPDGQVKLDVDVAATVHPRSSPPVTAEVKGPALIHVLATGGVMQPRGGDFSGWTAHAEVVGTGIALTIPVDQLVPGLQTMLTPVAYRCAGGTLYLTSSTGKVFTFVKA